MPVTVTVVVECDRCATDEYDVPPKHRLINKCRSDGWRIGKEVVCPECLYYEQQT